MAAKSGDWMERLEEILCHLRSLGWSQLDRAAVELIFGISRRSAIRLMREFGATGPRLQLDRLLLIQKLAEYQQPSAEEKDRRRAFAEKYLAMRKDRLERPRVEIAAPPQVVHTRLRHLIETMNLTVEPGRITVEFETPEQAVRKLLLLAMALDHDYSEFEELARLPQQPPPSPCAPASIHHGGPQ